MSTKSERNSLSLPWKNGGYLENMYSSRIFYSCMDNSGRVCGNEEMISKIKSSETGHPYNFKHIF
jgi:hypothetical protein